MVTGGEQGESRIGRIFHFRAVYLHDRGIDPRAPRTWRHDKARAGSGALGDFGSHVIDLARFLVGEVAEVSGTLQTFIGERTAVGASAAQPVDIDDAALALLRFENGALGSFEVSRFGMGRKNHLRIEGRGARGALVYNLERLNELELYDEEGPTSGFRTVLATHKEHPYIASWWPPGHLIGYEHTFIHTVLDFMKGIADGARPRPTSRTACAAIKSLDAIERASASRRWEAWARRRRSVDAPTGPASPHRLAAAASCARSGTTAICSGCSPRATSRSATGRRSWASPGR